MISFRTYPCQFKLVSPCILILQVMINKTKWITWISTNQLGSDWIVSEANANVESIGAPITTSCLNHNKKFPETVLVWLHICNSPLPTRYTWGCTVPMESILCKWTCISLMMKMLSELQRYLHWWEDGNGHWWWFNYNSRPGIIATFVCQCQYQIKNTIV